MVPPCGSRNHPLSRQAGCGRTDAAAMESQERRGFEVGAAAGARAEADIPSQPTRLASVLFRRDWLRDWAEAPRAAARNGLDSPRCLASKAPDFLVFLPNEGNLSKPSGNFGRSARRPCICCDYGMRKISFSGQRKPFMTTRERKASQKKDRNDSPIQSDRGACRR